MTNHNPRIMILTAGYGEGHVQTSKALKQRFVAQGVQNIDIVDLMKEAHPLLNTISTKLYIKSASTSKYGLDYYGWSYYMTRYSKPEGSWNKYFNNMLGKKKLKELIEHIQPDALINTFPFGAAPDIGRAMHIPTFTVVTDYALHSRWIHPDNEKYYVATPELKDELLAIGFDASQVAISGIPIRQAFTNANNGGNHFLDQLDPSKKTVLILAGSYGVLSHIEEMANTLRQQADCQLVVVCGRNEKLQEKLHSQFSADLHVHVFGFVEHIHELMSISSCVVTKAGGLTLTEALALRLPIFIFKPFAGQEKENALFFEQKGMAKISYSTAELQDQILHFLSDPAISGQMKQSMNAVYNGDAADCIVQDVMQNLARKLAVSV